jgi:glutamate formiminotransferase
MECQESTNHNSLSCQFIKKEQKMEIKIIECVPNISEGKDLEIVEKCVNEIKKIAELKLVDYSSDPDHNRSVITFIGPIEKVKEGVFQLTKRALELIDLNKQKGTHPRMGAVDVIPFVPLTNASMQDCIEASQELGERIGKELNLPVYLYANSAKSEDRKKLPTIRKGEFEGFDEKIKDPLWSPDYGPKHKHPTAGVVAIGAREFLVAFNIYLSTTNESVAQSIAQSIRESSGGHRFLQAKGMFIQEKNMTQVSMNILDFQKLPLYRVIELVRTEAKRYGATIVETELIGLIPVQAVLNSFGYYAQLPDLKQDQIIELKL